MDSVAEIYPPTCVTVWNISRWPLPFWRQLLQFRASRALYRLDLFTLRWKLFDMKLHCQQCSLEEFGTTSQQPAFSLCSVEDEKKKKKKERKRRKHLTRVPFLARIRSISLKFNRSPRREEHVLKRPAAAFHFNRLLSLQEYFVFPL